MKVVYEMLEWFLPRQVAFAECPTVRGMALRLFSVDEKRGWCAAACDRLVSSGHCEAGGFVCPEVREGMAIRTTGSLFEKD